ncbi:MAG: DUF305 domain-containing protein [Actinobacteria bacterium]|nr:DUF305 domain-containing protein [Actinomycetota bacterium]
MRRIVLIVAVAVAMLVAGSLVALAVSSRFTDAGGSAGPSGAATATADPVSANDYCYVEAMIFYRVSESRNAKVLLGKSGIDADARDFATATAERADAELVDLRAWYVSWGGANPAEPPVDGPCAGHGAEHAQMPGIPSWAQRQRLADAQDPATAQRLFAQLLHDQHAGMLALIAQVLDDQADPRVRASATAAREQAAADDAILERIAAA